jgi:hypothetical protein
MSSRIPFCEDFSPIFVVAMKPYHALPALAVLLFCIAGCNQTKEKNNKPDADGKLAEELAFDSDIISDLRNQTDSTFAVAEPNPDGGYGFTDSTAYKDFMKRNLRGIQFNVSAEQSMSIIADLHDKFKNKGYLLYISENNLGYGADEITVLKTSDMFDALRFEGTNGVNWDVFTEDIITKLKLWDGQFGLDIFAASLDVVQARYVQLPPDLKAHADEMYAFCPDIVVQGTGSVEALQQEIQKTKQLYLWWD